MDELCANAEQSSRECETMEARLASAMTTCAGNYCAESDCCAAMTMKKVSLVLPWIACDFSATLLITSFKKSIFTIENICLEPKLAPC